MARILSIDDWLAAQDPGTRQAINLLRQLVRDSHPSLDESIKWNASSFAHLGEDRVTLGVERGGGVRLVLHRGAQPQDSAGVRFEDPDHLCHWPAADRGVARFASAPEIAAVADRLQALVARWIVAGA